MHGGRVVRIDVVCVVMVVIGVVVVLNVVSCVCGVMAWIVEVVILLLLTFRCVWRVVVVLWWFVGYDFDVTWVWILWSAWMEGGFWGKSFYGGRGVLAFWHFWIQKLTNILTLFSDFAANLW